MEQDNSEYSIDPTGLVRGPDGQLLLPEMDAFITGAIEVENGDFIVIRLFRNTGQPNGRAAAGTDAPPDGPIHQVAISPDRARVLAGRLLELADALDGTSAPRQ